MNPKDFFSNEEEVEGLIKDLNDFINGKEPKNLRVYVIDKNGKQTEVKRVLKHGN